MSYIVFAWLTSIAYGLGSVIGKVATKHHIENPWLYNFLWMVLTTVCIVPLALYGGVGLPQDWVSMFWLGLANAVSGLLFIFAFYAADLSILSPLANLRTPFIAVSGVLFFGETLTGMQWVLIGVVWIAGMGVCLDEEMSLRSVISRKNVLALLWILSSVWFNLMIKYASQSNGYWEVSLWSSVIAIVLFLPTIPFFYRDVNRTHIRRYWGVSVSTVLYTAGWLFSVKAFGENVSISMAIISLPLAMIMTMIASRIAPKLLEQHTPKVYMIRFVAAAVMFAAALGLSK